jgi:GT2 family glycosyltransferase
MRLQFWLNKLSTFARIYRNQGLSSAIKKSARYLKRLILHPETIQTDEWLQRHRLTPQEIAAARADIASWSGFLPTFSVLVPVYNTKPALLRKAIESVKAQVYPHWQLYLVDDCSPSGRARKVMRKYAKQDDRIQTIYLPVNSGISKATNAALEYVSSDYIALLDHDDELEVNALYENAKVIRQHPETDVLYSDEDYMSEFGYRSDPFFKPDWSPEYFYGCMYTCHLGVYRTELVNQIGGFRPEYDGAQDWDLMLRASEKTSHIRHIPKILYHWRITKTSVTANSDVKPWAHDSSYRALTDMLSRSAYPGHVESVPNYPGTYRVRRTLLTRPLISIVIPSAGKLRPDGKSTHLETCLESIARLSTYTHYEIVLVDGYDIPPEVLDRVKSFGVKLIRSADPFNYSARVNLGVSHSQGDMLLLLNDDVEVLSPDWLEGMLELAQQDEIGAVGPKLLFPNGNIQHAGVVLVHGNPGHAFYNASGENHGYFLSNVINRNYLCVTGACLMVSRHVFDEVGGLDEILPLNFNDVDFCLKIHKAGYRNVCIPFVELIHHESATREAVVLAEEINLLHARWLDYLNGLGGDPYYNPNFKPIDCNFRI